MRLFITGGSGLLGYKIAEIASLKGYEVYSGYNKHTPTIGYPVKINLLEKSKLIETIKDIKPDAIIHTAAMTNVDQCETEKELAYRINFEGTKSLFSAANYVDAFFVYVSTDYIFDGEKGMYTETDTPNPINYYGLTKLLGEVVCEKCCIVRPSVIYGAKPASGKINFALWLIDKLEKNEEVKIVTDQIITPTLNTNLSLMILEIVEKKLQGIFHLAGASRLSRFDFAVEIAKVFDLDESLIKPISMSEISWVARRPKDSSLDTTKAKNVLSIKPLNISDSLSILKKEINKEE